MDNKESAKCRGCGMVLKGKPYWAGGAAYHPRTNERCPTNFYGGFVCSEQCDVRACREQEESMPGAGPARHLSSPAKNQIRSNWDYN